MEFSAKILRILAFDIHVLLDGIQRFDLFIPEFMNKAEKYEEFVRAKEETISCSHRFTPTPCLEDNHFWVKIGKRFSRDASAFFLPTLVESLDARPFKVCLPGLNEEIEANCHLLLWPWGWSTQIELPLEGSFTVEEMTAIRSFLKSRGNTQGIFKVGQKQMKLSHVFQKAGQDLGRALFEEEPAQVMTLPSFVINAIISAGGELKPFSDNRLTDLTPYSDAERNAFYDILFGEETSFEERPIKRKYVYDLPLRNGIDFALVNFASGALISLAYSVRNNFTSLEQAHCFVSNLRYYCCMMYGLQSYLNHADTPDGRIALARGMIREIPKRYQNTFTEKFVAINNTARKDSSHNSSQAFDLWFDEGQRQPSP